MHLPENMSVAKCFGDFPSPPPFHNNLPPIVFLLLLLLLTIP